ncbi:hypothetical protein JJB07_14755 [Tumebacillus sp. ITR2]|uniref:Uncharacterized protein n=1 Tax=Tumebacillus amylolyticus TaxID=2801339 RepID=A0ABS1JE85_9BACL|nr:hypothetical protein [Tumebacillus amylolyticus]MBL0387898.1 hypothetical protein [Tumebacillus amylolyticus]
MQDNQTLSPNENVNVSGCSACGNDHQTAQITSTNATGGEFECPDTQKPVSYTVNQTSDSPMIAGLTEGRIAHYVLPQARCFPNPEDRHRPAIVVNAHGGRLADGLCNLIVFLDGTNDIAADLNNMALTMWAPSIKYSDGKEPGTWHWPERV